MIFAELEIKIFKDINPLMSLTFDESRLIDSDPEVKLKKYTELEQKGLLLSMKQEVYLDLTLLITEIKHLLTLTEYRLIV